MNGPEAGAGGQNDAREARRRRDRGRSLQLASVAKAFGAGVFRVRVGDWRAAYELDGDRLVVVVIRVGHRSEVYRD